MSMRNSLRFAIVAILVSGFFVGTPAALGEILEAKASTYDIPLDGSLQIIAKSDIVERWVIQVKNPDSKVYTLDLEKSDTVKQKKEIAKIFPADWKPWNPNVNTLRAGTYSVTIIGSESGRAEFSFRVYANTPAEKAVTELADRIAQLDKVISIASQIEDEIQSIKSEIVSIREMITSSDNLVDKKELSAQLESLERKLNDIVDQKFKQLPNSVSVDELTKEVKSAVRDSFDENFRQLNSRIDGVYSWLIGIIIAFVVGGAGIFAAGYGVAKRKK